MRVGTEESTMISYTGEGGLLMRVGNGESTITTTQKGAGRLIMGVGGEGENALDSTYSDKSRSMTGMSSGSARFFFSSQTRGTQGTTTIIRQY